MTHVGSRRVRSRHPEPDAGPTYQDEALPIQRRLPPMFSGMLRRAHPGRSCAHRHPSVEPLETRSLMASGVTEFSSGITSNVGAMTLAPDGTFWFDAQFQDVIGSFDPVTEQA